MTERFIERFYSDSEYHIVGILDDKESIRSYKGAEIIGGFSELSSVLAEKHVDEIIIILNLDRYADLGEMIGVCEKTGIQTKLIPDCSRAVPTVLHMEDLEGMPLISINYSPLTDAGGKAIKRMFDIAGAMVSIILFTPIMIITFIVLKLTSSEPAI